MMKFQFGLSTCENYILVPKLWKNYRMVLGSIIRNSGQNEDELWARFQYSYKFMTFSIWSSNLRKLQFDP